MARIAYLTTIDFGAGEIAGLPAALAELGIARPLLVSDRGIAASGLLARAAALLPPGTPAFLDTPPNPTEAAVAAALERLARRGLRRDRRPGRRLAHRPRQGRGAPRHPSGTARAVCGDLRRPRADHAGGRAGRRGADHGRDRGGGGAGGAPDPRRRAQARGAEPAPHPEPGDLRPRAHPRPAAGADRGDRPRRALALHRDLPLAARQPAGRGDRARRRRADLAQPRDGLPRRRRTSPRGAS